MPKPAPKPKSPATVPRPSVQIKPYAPGQALDPPTPIDGPPPELDAVPHGDPNATPEHDTVPEPTDEQRELDQAAALGLTLAAYRGLNPPDPDAPPQPTMPGFAMSDEPFDPAPSFTSHVSGGGAEVIAATPGRPPPLDIVEDRTREQQALDGDLLPPLDAPQPNQPPPGAVRYESRIRVVEAWRYPGNLTGAPAWIDRNWIGFADFDDLRKLEPGPCLRVPIHGDPYAHVVCRVGDYMARQEVKLVPDLPGEIQVQVWEAEQFQRLFIPR
jgi:hypothetical protein